MAKFSKTAVLVVVVVLGALTSCVEKQYIVPALTAIVPREDNSQSDCEQDPNLTVSSPVSPRTIYVKYVQDKADVKKVSIVGVAGDTVRFPAIYVPRPTIVSVVYWASNSKGFGCERLLPITPTIIQKAQ
jgi:hypothetical protein